MDARILIVDDEPGVRTLYRRALEGEGYEVAEADSGCAALEELAAEKPDLVVLDICMPGADGIKTLGLMLDVEPGLPVVLNSAYGGYMGDFMTWAAEAYIVKSGDLGLLLETVKRILAARSAPARQDQPASCCMRTPGEMSG